MQKVHRLNPDMEASSPETLDKIEKFHLLLPYIISNGKLCTFSFCELFSTWQNNTGDVGRRTREDSATHYSANGCWHYFVFNRRALV